MYSKCGYLSDARMFLNCCLQNVVIILEYMYRVKEKKANPFSVLKKYAPHQFSNHLFFSMVILMECYWDMYCKYDKFEECKNKQQ